MDLDQKAPHPLGWGAFLMEIKFDVSLVSVRLWTKYWLQVLNLRFFDTTDNDYQP